MSLPPAICIMGPTASGKTSLAVELVQLRGLSVAEAIRTLLAGRDHGA